MGTKELLSFYLNEKKDIGSSYDLSALETLNRVLNDDEYSCNIDDVRNLLDFINCEDVKFNLSDSEYVSLLKNLKGRFESYLNFAEDDSNLTLLAISVGQKKNEIVNKFYQFEKFEQTLVNSSQKKKALLVSLCYRSYDRSFLDQYGDISVTAYDVCRFVNSYEKTGKILSASQIKNLLDGFRQYYLDKNELLNEEKEMSSRIREKYLQFRKKNYTASVNRFIASINLQTRCYNFKGIYEPFNYKMFEQIINGNNLYGFEWLINTRSFKNYSNVTGYTLESSEKASERYRSSSIHRAAIYNRYYKKLSDYEKNTGETMQYFIRENVSPYDMDDFMDIMRWYENRDDFNGWNLSPEIYEATACKLQKDLYEKLKKCRFKDRKKVFEKYLLYIKEDGIDSYVSSSNLELILSKYEEEYIEENSENLFEAIKKKYDKFKNLLDTLEYLGLDSNHVEKIFELVLEKDPTKDSAVRLIRKALEVDTDFEKSELSDEERSKLSRKYLRKFLDGNYTSLTDFYVREGTKVKALFIDSIAYVKDNDPDLYQEFVDKKESLLSKSMSDEIPNLENIVNGICNGVKTKDGHTRDFTYLDYCLMTSISLNTFMKQGVKYAKEHEMNTTVLFNFQEKYDMKNPFSLKGIFKENFVFKINGEDHSVTEEEKIIALDYIRDKELPREYRIFGDVVKAHLSGELSYDGKIKVNIK